MQLAPNSEYGYQGVPTHFALESYITNAMLFVDLAYLPRHS